MASEINWPKNQNGKPAFWESRFMGTSTASAGNGRRTCLYPSGGLTLEGVGTRERAPQIAGTLRAAGAADLGADVAEGVVGVAAQRRDGGDAYHEDQGQHDCVLDRRRAVLVLQKVHRLMG